MPRSKKEYKPVSIKMDSELFNEFDLFCEKSGMSKTSAIEKAIQLYIEVYYEKMGRD